MPYIFSPSSRASIGSDSVGFTDLPVEFLGQSMVSDASYAEKISVLDNNTEKALSEQLEPIAVIGMGCRLPGDVKSPRDFWNMMINRETGQMDKVPKSRFDIDAHFHENNDRPGSFAVKGGYFLHETLKEFDHTFFGVTPIEAMWMDPQQRKLLEVVYETFESAGTSLEEVAGSQTAVFVASFTADFQQMAFKEPSFRHSLAATGVDPGIISNRISHVFNLKGPSIVVNTACSSSVYAMHNACNALRNKECAGAIVGGVNLVLTVDQHMNTAKLGVLSQTSTCHTFDESADGYGRAEGVGAVYLKRLSDAIRDGDPIRGVLRSSATNNNGKVAGVGITHPNLEGQEGVIRHAYSRGGDLDPRLTGLFECHGTGTAVGDPLEVHAVSNAMNERRESKDGPLLVGAVKANIGHSEAASGLSAIIKAVLTVERGIIPATRGVTKPNAAIDWKGWQVGVNHEATPFPAHLPVKRVSVNSFGYGGTNAHMIVESADSLLTIPQTYKFEHALQSRVRPFKSRGKLNRNRPFLLPFSAHNKAALRRNIKALGETCSDHDLLDLARTLGNHRTRFNSRGVVVASAASLTEAFADDLSHFTFLEQKAIKQPTLGFIFTGQGAQWARMGAELITYYPSFRHTIQSLDTALGDLGDAPEWTIEDKLLEPIETSQVNEAEFSQPLCTAIQIAIVNLLHSWNITPRVTVGHSSGEMAAAYAAGLISASDAIIAAYYRGKVVRDVPGHGAMLAVGLGAGEVEPYLVGTQRKVVVACHNSPGGVTLSGDEDAIESVRRRLEDAKVFARIVKTNGKAYHSFHMQPVAAEYEKSIRRAREMIITPDSRLNTGAKMVSSVYNKVLGPDFHLDEKYWSANLLSPVLFNQAMQTVATTDGFADVDLFIEIGPHAALAGPVRQIKAQNKLANLNHLPSLTRNSDSAACLLRLVGELFLRDYAFDVARVTAVEEATPSGKVVYRSGALLVDLPPYQWDKTKEYMAEARMSKEHRAPSHMRHDILGSRILGGSKSEPTWRNVLRLRDLSWLQDHSLGGEAVFPAAGYFSMAIEAITQLNETSDRPVAISGYTLRDVSIKNALVTPDDDNGIEVILCMHPSLHAQAHDNSVWWDFNVSSIDHDGINNNHMAGSIAINGRPSRPAARRVPEFTQRASGKAWNQALRSVGFDYGPTFQDMHDISFDGKTYAAASKTALRTSVAGVIDESRHVLHPACVDSCLQLLIVAIYAGRTAAMPCGAVPIQVDELSIWVPTAEQLAKPEAYAFSWIDKRGVRTFVGSNQLVASDGDVMMEITDIRCSLYEAAVPQRDAEPATPRPYGQMVWKQDVDTVIDAKSPAISVAHFIELLEFKRPVQKAVDLTGDFFDHLSDLLPDLDLHRLEQEGNDLEGSVSKQSLKHGAYDLVISPPWTCSEDIEYTQNLLALSGRVILVSTDTTREKEALQGAGLRNVQKFQSFVTGVNSEKQPEAKELQKGLTVDTIKVIYREATGPPEAMYKALKDTLKSRGCIIESSRLDDPGLQAQGSVLFLADLDRPLLVDITEREFEGLQRVTNEATSLLWVTNGDLTKGRIPGYNMTAGLTRCLRSEQPALNIVTVDFDLTAQDPSQADILARMIFDQIHGRLREREYSIVGGQTQISRLVYNHRLNSTYSVDKSAILTKPFKADEPLVGAIENGKVVFHAFDTDEPLGDEEIEVQVLVGALNKEDTLVVTGQDYPTDFSHEIGGIVTKVGAAAQLAPGDLVAGFSFDRFATVQRVVQGFVHKVDSEAEMMALCGMPMAFGAALFGLENSAALRAGESVLVLPGAGLAGNAAVHVTRALGGKPFIGVVDVAEIPHVASLYNLPREQVICVGSLSGTHVEFDVIFSSGWVNPTLAHETWRRLAPLGRFVDSGRKNVLRRTVLDTIPVSRGASYLSFDMVDLYEQRPQILVKLMKRVAELFTKRQILPLQPQVRKNIADVNDAVATFSDSALAGKTLLEYKTQATGGSNLLLVKPTIPSAKLRPDVTYLLIGCLGGLGRSLTSWMMAKGARNFTFMSRSGATSKQAEALVSSLQKEGANVQVIRGDASVREDVDRAIKEIDPSRPVRGVIHAAMVLKDGLFHNMPYSNWQRSTEPKVQGAMNLHNALATVPLDFFIVTSSISGTLGTPAQSNYAAGNTYMDALARHRVAQGLRAASIVIPMVLGVGVVAENVELEAALKRKGMYGIDDSSLLAAFETAILEQQQQGHGEAESVDHLVAGLDPELLAAAIYEAGEEVDCFWTADERFNKVVKALSGSGTGQAGGEDSLLESLRSGEMAFGEAKIAVAELMAGKLARMLMLDSADVHVDEGSVASYGIDSMIGAELRSWIFKELAVDMPFQQLLGASLTINKFAELICSKHKLVVD